MFVMNFSKIENFEFTNLDVDYLKHNNNCPVCSYDKRSHKVNSPDQDQYNLYFQAIASYLKTTQVELHKKINVYICKKCDTEYCDPWFKTEISNILYSIIFGQHRMGWSKLNYWAADKEEVDSSMGDLDIIWNYIKKYSKKIDIYGELNCPFQGFFGKFAKILYESDEKFKNESLNHLIHMRKTYKNPTFPGYAVKMPNQPSTHLPEERILIIEPSSMFWGSNCSFNNISCYSTAQSLFGIKKCDLKDIKRENIKFDVIGAYNLFDHFFDPLKILSKLTNASKLVVLTLHGLNDTIGKQHLFKFGPNFPTFLKKIGYNIFEIPSEEIMPNPDDIRNSTTMLVSKSINFNL